MTSDRSSLTIIILSFNEEIHIERCLKCAFQVASQVFVVDSFSTDRTVTLAKDLGASVWQHEFINHATQLAWALENLPIDTEWVMRMDADEIISSSLADEIKTKLFNTSQDINGFTVPLYVCFLGKIIRYGGYPQRQLRIWRNTKGRIEQRWMDEKILVDGGRIEKLRGEYIDYNLNHITWWTTKHNNYATRDAIDLLNKKYTFLPSSTLISKQTFKDSGIKRLIKNNLYAHIPIYFRAFLFFIYRYVFLFGFIDGKNGLAFHFLQCFWYRFLVDVKIWEVERVMRDKKMDCVNAIRNVLGINLHDINAVHNTPR